MFQTNIYVNFYMGYNCRNNRIFDKGPPMNLALNPAQQEKALKLELRLAQLEKNEACQNNFLPFVKAMWPEFIAGRHHKIIADKL